MYWNTDDVTQKKQKTKKQRTENKTTPNKTQLTTERSKTMQIQCSPLLEEGPKLCIIFMYQRVNYYVLDRITWKI